MSAGSGNRISAPMQALDHKSNSLPLSHCARHYCFIFLLSFFSDDAYFKKMTSYISSAGRTPALSKVKLTYRLLMQLECIRLQARKKWTEIEDFFPFVCDFTLVNSSLSNEINRLYSVLKTADNINSEEFWNTDAEEFLDYRNIGPFLKEVRLIGWMI